MATTATTFFGNRARAAIVAAGASPAVADLLTVTRGFEATFSWEHAELYGTDSTVRQDEARHTNKNEVTLKACKMYSDNSGTGGLMDMILNTMNGSSPGSGAIGTTPDVYLMDVYIWGIGSETGATNRYCLKISNAYMEKIPFIFPENDYVTIDLTLKGRTGAITNTALPT